MLFATCFTLSEARHADHTLVLSTLGASLKVSQSHDPFHFRALQLTASVSLQVVTPAALAR